MINEFTVILSCIEYKVTVADRQVIFKEARPLMMVELFASNFTLERPVEINDTGGIWYLSDSTMVPVSHIVQALKWCEEQFGKSFEEYKGALALR